MSNNEIFGSISVVFAILLLAMAIMYLESSCKEGGGKFFRTAIWFECVGGK